MAGRRRHTGAHVEEHENAERWLVTYADMITLLMVLFIVMFAMSQVDQRKFNALKVGLAAGFGQSTSLMDGSSSLLDQPGTAEGQPIVPPEYTDAKPALDNANVATAVSEHVRLANERTYAAAAAEVERLSDLEARLLEALRKQHLGADIRTTIDGRGLTISLVSQHVVFDANLASLTPRGRRVVDTLAPVLRDIPDDVQITGHTNQLGGRPKFYATDWDLAAARAVTVLRRLNEHDRVPAHRLSAASYGQQRPLMDPSRKGAQELNKRVDIVILSSLPDESADLIARVVEERNQEKEQGS